MKILAISLKILPLFSLLFILMIGSSLHRGNAPLMPALFLIPVYYWLIYHPRWLPLWGLLVLGLIYDSLMGHSLGLSSGFLVASGLLGSHVRVLMRPDQFTLMWGGFGVYSGSYLLLYALLTGGGLPLFLAWINGILFYPLVAWGLSSLHLRIQNHV